MDNAELSWHWPWMLLLFPLPLLVRWLLPEFKRQQAALRVPRLNDWLSNQAQETGPGSFWQPIWIPLALWLLFVVALARPYWLGDEVAVPVSGRDLLLAVDISGSMQQEDMNIGQRRATRLMAVKRVVEDFIERRESDRIGLLLFGSNAYVQAPLTFDHTTVTTYLNEAQIGLAGKETAIGNAIGLGIKRLIDHPAENRVLILLTDGANTAGDVDPRDAARLAADNQVKIYSIGLGAEVMEVPGLFGTRRVNPSRDLDEALLADIASYTGGQFFRARDTQELAKIYRAIEKLEPIEQDPEVYRPQKNLYHWPLGAALICSILYGLAGALGVKLNPGFRTQSSNVQSDTRQGSR